MIRLLEIAGAVLPLLLVASIAQAQQFSSPQQRACLDASRQHPQPRDRVIALLQSDRYGETIRGMGVDGDRGLITEIYVSEDGGTWTIISTDTDGQTCIIAEGEMWESGPSGPPGEPT